MTKASSLQADRSLASHMFGTHSAGASTAYLAALPVVLHRHMRADMQAGRAVEHVAEATMMTCRSLIQGHTGGSKQFGRVSARAPSIYRID